MKLKCIRDKCPVTGWTVDMRRCCGEHSWSKPCKHYGKKPWTEYMYVTCMYPLAQSQAQAQQDHEAMSPDLDKDGLFCFYDDEKSQEVAHCCRMLAERLKSFWDDSWTYLDTKSRVSQSISQTASAKSKMKPGGLTTLLKSGRIAQIQVKPKARTR